MFDRKKVEKMKMTEEGYKSSDKSENQADYEKKVKKFLTYCRNFENALVAKNNLETVENIRTCFNNSFNEYYSKLSKRLGLFSRTTKVLKEMDKKLKKLGNLEINNKNGSFSKIRDAFEYKREMPKNGNIKRSAIDDKAVYGFFNGTVLKTIKELRTVVKGKIEEVEFMEKSLENAKFENRFDVLKDKIDEVTSDLDKINNKRKKYLIGEKAFQKNDNFIKEIIEKVTEVSGKIKESKGKFNTEKEKLRKYIENGVSDDPKFDELECKKTIHNIKNDVEQYSKEVKKLKSDTEKAIKEFNKIEHKASDSFKLKNNGTLTINGSIGLSAFLESPFHNYNNCFIHSVKVKTVVMNHVSNADSSRIFCRFENLTSVTAKSLKGAIGEYVFDGCEKLASFNKGNSYDYNIPASVETICNYAFYKAGKEVSNGFSANVGAKDINSFVFAEGGVSKINLPNINTIGPYAFNGCEKLKEVILGQSITADNIKDGAFKSCKNLSKVTLSKNISEDEIAKLKDKICEQASKGEKTEENPNGIEFIIQ